MLESEGYAALTLEGIAALAGVGKTTIYRWWPGKAYLVLEIYESARHQIAVPSTGNLERDLTLFLQRTFTALTTTNAGATMVALMAEAQRDKGFGDQLQDRFIAKRRAALRSVFEHAVGRGELASDLDFDTAVDATYGAMWYRLLNRHGPLNRRFALNLVRQIVCGLGPAS